MKEKALEIIAKVADEFIRENNEVVVEPCDAIDADYYTRFSYPIGDEYSDSDGGWETVGNILRNCADPICKSRGYVYYPHKSVEYRRREAWLEEYNVMIDDSIREKLIEALSDVFAYYLDDYEKETDEEEANEILASMAEEMKLRLKEDVEYGYYKLRDRVSRYDADDSDAYLFEAYCVYALERELLEIRDVCEDRCEQIVLQSVVNDKVERFTIARSSSDDELYEFAKRVNPTYKDAAILTTVEVIDDEEEED